MSKPGILKRCAPLLIAVVSVTVTVKAQQAPTVAVDAATQITGMSALITGTVNPNGLPTAWHIVFGATTAYGQTSVYITLPAQGMAVAVGTNLYGLSPNTTYHYQLVATNSAGQGSSADMTLTTSAGNLPIVSVDPADGVTSSNAIITGTINPNGLAAGYYVQWGTNASYGNWGPVGFLQAQNTPAGVTNSINYLAPNTTYHYRLVGTNNDGIGYSTDRTLTTLSPPLQPPTVSTGPVTAMTATNANVTGTVNPNGWPTTYHFQWGTNTAYGNVLSPVSLTSGLAPVDVSAGLTGLVTATTYHYQLVASNSAGVALGGDQVFTTPGVITIAGNTFNYTVNAGVITITGYSGPGGNMAIPRTVNGVPVTTIGQYAFVNAGLTSVIIPGGVTNIGSGAFWSCNGLTNVALPGGLITIGGSAFASCSALAEVIIPSSVTDIGSDAFSWCTSLQAITVDVLNPAYSSQAGVLFDKSQQTLIQFPGGKAGDYTAPNGVLSILDDAFSGNTNLTRIVLPSGVTNIGGGAFINCVSLTSASLPDSLIGVGLYAFSGCSALTNLTLPEGVTSIGRVAFASCSGLTTITIPASVSSIGDSVFVDCTGLRSVTIANSVLGPSEFSGSTNLANVTVSGPVSSIPDFTFAGCTSLEDITIPAGVTNIGVNAFASCASLTSIALPDSVASIADGVIGWGLTGAFSDCTSLTNVTLGKRLTYIGAGAFVDCIGLTSMTIPAGVTNIGQVAFGRCTNLVALYFQGNAPTQSPAFLVPLGGGAISPTIYYLPGTTGWGTSFDGCTTVLWNPQMQTADGSFGVGQNGFGFNIAGTAAIPIIIEASGDPAAAWVPVQSCTLTNGLVYFSDPQWANYPIRFYRIRSP